MVMLTTKEVRYTLLITQFAYLLLLKIKRSHTHFLDAAKIPFYTSFFPLSLRVAAMFKNLFVNGFKVIVIVNYVWQCASRHFPGSGFMTRCEMKEELKDLV